MMTSVRGEMTRAKMWPGRMGQGDGAVCSPVLGPQGGLRRTEAEGKAAGYPRPTDQQ